ncbi:MAG: GAF domain-containing protein, partial [Candidatus Sericytochromatia bacterium]|nr:GAF domain-containing protein [Candidatus Sericytochromatia bacterium]
FGAGFLEVSEVSRRHSETKGVTLCDAAIWTEPDDLLAMTLSAGYQPQLLILVGAEAEIQTRLDAMADQTIPLAILDLPISPQRLTVTLQNYLELAAMRQRLLDSGKQTARFQYELNELVEIARAIASERDISKLLGLILEKSRYITAADAGSVYIVEGLDLPPEERTLRFTISQNDSLDIDFRQFTLKDDNRSIVGHAVLNRTVVNIPDLYRLDEPENNPWGFRHDKQFDQKIGYQGHSMLTVPMMNQNDDVIGVIQLINRKRDGVRRLKTLTDFQDQVIPFDHRSEELARTLASQAGISLENTLLYEDITRLFESFVNAAVSAIEVRDPTTSGHSQRVATLTCELAKTIDQLSDGQYAQVNFSRDDLKEIQYAGLLHDFGKVGVREQVLLKSKKLLDSTLEVIKHRFDFIRMATETEMLRRQMDLITREGATPSDERLLGLIAESDRRLAELDEILAFIVQANEPSVLAQGGFEQLHEIAARSYVNVQGERRPFLSTEEVLALSVERGSLTKGERVEIERHVVHTIAFLENIPWGRKFRNVPAIAGAHHEKLDGTGYPYGLPAESIRIESRMMSIADIFDALTASDRPYKSAVPLPKALDIIGYEVKAGKCDADLYRIFLEAKPWTSILPDS